MITTALMTCTSASAQQSEMENYQAGGDALLTNQREVTQHNIDAATRALQARDFKTARRYAQSVARADPKRVESWRMLGAAQIGLQDWSGARRSYIAAVRILPADPESRAGLGVAMAHTNDQRATEQLAWLNAKAQACVTSCEPLIRHQARVEAAISAAAKGS